jgi:hypothetical protein
LKASAKLGSGHLFDGAAQPVATTARMAGQGHGVSALKKTNDCRARLFQDASTVATNPPRSKDFPATQKTSALTLVSANAYTIGDAG